MPRIGGLDYTYNELVRMSGLSQATLIRRYAENPQITLQALIAPPKVGGKPRRMITVRDKEMSVLDWAMINAVRREDIDKRWRIGIRDPDKLIQGLVGTAELEDEFEASTKLPTISDEMVEWLQETKYARKGMPDEWQIACELIGVSPKCANELREYMEARK